MLNPHNPSRPRQSISFLEHDANSAMVSPGVVEQSSEPGTRNILRLVRKYAWLGIALGILGVAGGIVSVVLSSPIYKVRALLEVQGINEAWLKNSFELSSSYDSNQINIQTQIKLLQSGPFMRRVYDRLQAETVPPPPVQLDFFSRLRRHVRNDIQNPIEIMTAGLQTAFESFDARPVNGTRLIELSCDSTNPQMAAQFINTMAGEFLDDTMRARSQSSQKTNEWLTAQIEETRIKLQESEQRLQEFVQRSGNLFASQDGTLDESKLKQLQDELAAIQADRIAKQTRYEMAQKAPAETLPEVLDDEALREYARQIADLQREKASLETTLTPRHSKVQKVDAQLGALQANLQTQIASVVARIQNEYEAARRREALLASAYSSQLQRVSSVAGKSAEHNALKREVETHRQMYQSLLVQANQTDLSSSVPVNPIRLVEPSSPPNEPYRPQPILNMSFGLMVGLLVTGGIAFLREKLDRSVRHPATSQRLLNVPQLGVIPSAALNQPGLLARFRRVRPERQLNGGSRPAVRLPETALTAWGEGGSFLAESFRATLASLTRNSGVGEPPKTIVITSPSPGEGKTTVASNLAMALAETGRKVLLVDADFRRPRLHRVFGVPNTRGLIDLVTDQTSLSDSAVAELIIPTGSPNLVLLVNRPVPANVSKALYSPRLRNILENLRRGYDIILLDTPPLLPLADTRLISRWSDGVILVLRAGSTDQERALEACHRIQDDGLTLIGTVLNDWNPGKSHMKRHYYYEYKHDS